MRVLVVEDHAATRKLLEGALRESGHTPDGAADLATARQKVATGGYALVVLDWMLPDGSGLDLCREMRGTNDSTPILVLTARGDVDDRVEGLDAGADDYLKKPFAVAEFRARVRALLRRGPRLELTVARLGPVDVHITLRRVMVHGKEVPITAREFSILEVLLRRRGGIVPRSDILLDVWGEETENSAASLEVLLGRLRRKLASSGGEGLIRTHRGIGYSIEWKS